MLIEQISFENIREFEIGFEMFDLFVFFSKFKGNKKVKN